MSKTHDDDLALAQAAQQGDRAAFEALLTRHYETMYKFAYKYCGDKDIAEDITQEACIKLARAIGKYKGKSAFTSWLYTVVLNVARDEFRHRQKHAGQAPLYEDMVKADGQSADETLYTQQVWQAVQGLPDGEREAVLLVCAEGLTHKEAAAVLDCAEGTISWRVAEARKKLEGLR